jgi:hypothetical protein
VYGDEPRAPIVVAPRRPVFRMLEGRRVGQNDTHAVFDWVNRGSPVQIQFIQGGGVSVERVTLDGRNVYDKDDPSPRVNFDPMLTVPSGSALLIVTRRFEGKGVSVQLGAFVSPSDATGASLAKEKSGMSYVDMGLESITQKPDYRSGGIDDHYWLPWALGGLFVVYLGGMYVIMGRESRRTRLAEGWVR